MNNKTAGLALLGTSVILALLMLTQTISVTTGCLAFAIAMVILGLHSRGFTRC